MRYAARLSGGLLLAASFTASAIPSAILTGVTWYDPTRAWNGFVLFPGSDNQTHLIDMTGKEVQRWHYEGFPSWPVPLDRAGGQPGHLLVQLERQQKLAAEANPGNGLVNASVAEVDWKGKVQWHYGSQQQPVHQHHEIQRLPNGNTLVLGAALRQLPGYPYRIIDNSIEEISPQGQIVWEYVSPFYGKAMPRDHYVSNTVYRAYMVDYRWAPAGTPHSEQAVAADCTRYPALPGCLPSK